VRDAVCVCLLPQTLAELQGRIRGRIAAVTLDSLKEELHEFECCRDACR